MTISIQVILFYGSAIIFSIFLSLCIFLIAVSKTYPVVTRSKREKYYVDPSTGKVMPLPSYNDPPSINLSIVVPAYNEAERLPPMLDECYDYLEKRSRQSNFTYEIIVVIDGSTDRTFEVAVDYSLKFTSEKFRILDLKPNRGKGGAVRLGVQNARGALILFADADGATKFSEIEKLEDCISQLTKCDLKTDKEKLANEKAIAIGSRAHLEEEAIASRSIFRNFLMHGFHLLVWLFAVKGIKDTQCGFKIFTREAARLCFESLHVERWAFDVELLYIAQQKKIPIMEIPVQWTEIEGSKIVPVWSWLQMGLDLGLIWLRYLIGAWKIKEN